MSAQDPVELGVATFRLQRLIELHVHRIRRAVAGMFDTAGELANCNGDEDDDRDTREGWLLRAATQLRICIVELEALQETAVDVYKLGDPVRQEQERVAAPHLRIVPLRPPPVDLTPTDRPPPRDPGPFAGGPEA
jgi:hypothetical protein